MKYDMTNEERATRSDLIYQLGEEGHIKYGELLRLHNLNLTSDPKSIGYMEPATGRIVINRGLGLRAASFVIRHEILHFHLEHELRLLYKLAQEAGIDPKVLLNATPKEIEKVTSGLTSLGSKATVQDLKNELYKNKLFNYAGDYEISNRGYTEEDKELAKNLTYKVGDEAKTVKGLVTDKDHPEWADMTVGEIYDELRKNPPPPPPKPSKKKKPIIVRGSLGDDGQFYGEDGQLIDPMKYAGKGDDNEG